MWDTHAPRTTTIFWISSTLSRSLQRVQTHTALEWLETAYIVISNLRTPIRSWRKTGTIDWNNNTLYRRVCTVNNIVNWIGCSFRWGIRFGTRCWSRTGWCSCRSPGSVSTLLWRTLLWGLALSWSSLLSLLRAYSSRCYPTKSVTVLVGLWSHNPSCLSTISTYLKLSLSST